MAILKSLDGRFFEMDDQKLEQYRIPDEQVQSSGEQLPPAPPPRMPDAIHQPVSVQSSVPVDVQPMANGGYVVNIWPSGTTSSKPSGSD
jgi:hypothetical protein